MQLPPRSFWVWWAVLFVLISSAMYASETFAGPAALFMGVVFGGLIAAAANSPAPYRTRWNAPQRPEKNATAPPTSRQK